eukprot:TRINITY_DN67_c0_g1_i1.p1 TRINITY_DN67_c0_g1~~TRINITY_DN67_c0_g1_i1.p1  ORF type:complete len:995 (-),score=204.69 TRINITY_DN67_c0_g1_i1:1224-3914(-)
MEFPQHYPHKPPTVTLATPIPHPCVQGNTINLDMFDLSTRGLYEGWTSGYSVLSILIQLQSFLFEVTEDTKEMKQKIREAVRKANEYSNLEVGHKGPLSPWPTFNQKETDLKSFTMIKTEKELIQEEMKCFHTKLGLNESPLGTGVSISRLPRTGEIRSVEPTLDLISLKAYMKEGVRNSLDNTAFTHWLPLYFGLEKERTLYLARKSLSMICTGSTKRFEEKFILDVMPKLLLTTILSMMEQKEYTSLKALRMLSLFHRLFVLLLEEHPALYEQIDTVLQNFTKEEKFRIKDNLPSLGDMLSMMTVSKKVSWKDVIGPYLGEQMDRQVFWMLKEIPELEKEQDEMDLDEDRDKISFQTGKVGFFITMFYSYFVSKVCKPEGKDISAITSYMDEYFGRLPSITEDSLQEECKAIRDVKNFDGYFRRLGLPLANKDALVKALKTSIDNSKRKKYHGCEAEFSAIPEKDIMVKNLLDKYLDMEQLVDKKGKLLDAKDPKWKENCLKKFSWIRKLYKTLKNPPSPAELAYKSDMLKMNPKDHSEKEKELGKWNPDTVELPKVTAFEDYPSTMGWKELFLKLDFEYFLSLFGYNPDFKKFYKMMELIQPICKNLCILVISKKNLKSGFHWLTSLLTRLTGLECLKLYTNGTGGLNTDAMKCLNKGLNNFKEKGGKLLKLQIVKPIYSIEHKIALSLKCLPDLRVIRLRNMNLTLVVAQALNRILTDFKFIKELDVKNCGLNAQCGKEIADGLMRAKQLEILKLANNPNLNTVVSNIVYNLAFSPKINYLDISDINLSAKTTESEEAIFKLLTISGSLETLLMKNTNINNYFRLEFYKALGENKTLKCLIIDGSTINNASNLGKAISMNKKKEWQSRISLFAKGYSQLLPNGQLLWRSLDK